MERTLPWFNVNMILVFVLRLIRFFDGDVMFLILLFEKYYCFRIYPVSDYFHRILRFNKLLYFQDRYRRMTI